MHELSIAVSIVDLACDELARHGAVRADAVHLRLGQLAGVVKEALLFCFESAAAGTPIDGARLQIEEVPGAAWCPGCRGERALSSAMRRRCPVCGALMPDIVRGEELELVALEIADA